MFNLLLIVLIEKLFIFIFLQGQENDIILLSLVRSNKEGKIGYLSSMNRLCVAISRARCGLYLFGNHTHLANASKKGWKVGVSFFLLKVLKRLLFLNKILVFVRLLVNS